MTTFAAPWGRALRVISALATLLLCGAALWPSPMPVWVRLALLAFPACCALFIVRDYAIADGWLIVRRPFWTTRLPLAALRSARVAPDALNGSIRTCGNGGLYSFIGFYWSRRLGHFRAFVTDLRRCVVLEFESRKIVVSPEHPQEFAAEISARASDAAP